jgi:hypothetical protein
MKHSFTKVLQKIMALGVAFGLFTSFLSILTLQASALQNTGTQLTQVAPSNEVNMVQYCQMQFELDIESNSGAYNYTPTVTIPATGSEPGYYLLFQVPAGQTATITEVANNKSDYFLVNNKKGSDTKQVHSVTYTVTAPQVTAAQQAYCNDTGPQNCSGLSNVEQVVNTSKTYSAIDGCQNGGAPGGFSVSNVKLTSNEAGQGTFGTITQNGTSLTFKAPSCYVIGGQESLTWNVSDSYGKTVATYAQYVQADQASESTPACYK